jgi:serine/threonine-protein kinase
MPSGGNGDGDGKSPSTEIGVAATVRHPVPLYGEELAAGASVGLYVIEEMVGRGGFACVYRGRHIRDGTAVAIKVLHGKLAYSATAFQRFQREIETTRELDHPAIVRHIEWGQLASGRPYTVMEWLEGDTLRGVIERRGPMAIDVALPLLDALARALAVVHQQSLVHRDLKPTNVLVLDEVEPRLKLLDFGMVRLIDDQGQRLTATGTPLGTPGYMAPEQILGSEVGPAVDVYALGVIAFEMLTGKLPFQAPTAVEVQELHLRASPPRVSEETPVPASVDEVIRHCLDKDPRRRPSPVTAVIEQLAAAAANPGRPTSRFASGETVALGVYMTGDAEALSSAGARADAAGLSLAMEEDGELLWVLPLRQGDSDERARVLELGRSLAGEPRLTIRVHEAKAAVLSIGGATQVTGGDLLELATWPAVPATPGVFLSEKLAGGLEPTAFEAVPGFPEVRRLRRG